MVSESFLCIPTVERMNAATRFFKSLSQLSLNSHAVQDGELQPINEFNRMMQSTSQFNSSVAASMEQRDDSEYKSTCELTREQPSDSTNAPNGYINNNSIIQQTREHWSKRLSGSVPSPSHEGYTCHDAENSNTANATAPISHVMDKLKSIQVPKSLFSSSSSLDNNLVAHHSNDQSTLPLGNAIKRQQLMSMIQSKSDKLAAETSKSWTVLVETTAEMGKHILVERGAEMSKFSDKFGKLQNQLGIRRVTTTGDYNNSGDCYHDVGARSHVREVSFDYQLMNDTDYSSAPISVLKQ
jgi:hypothetical protein